MKNTPIILNEKDAKSSEPGSNTRILEKIESESSSQYSDNQN